VYRAGAWGPWFRRSILPHGAVRPKNVEEIQGILNIANRDKIPIVPFSTGFEQTSWQGGLVLDTYSRMKKIHQIDTESGYVLVEPGVTCGQLLKEIRPLGYWIPFGSFPPTFSMVTTLVCNAAYTNSMGREDDPVIGVEAVLPTGELLRTGTAGLGFDWWCVGRALRDLRLLFSPSNGTTGIITKAALRILPLGEAQTIVIGGFNNFDNAVNWTNMVTREMMVNTSMVWSYRWAQWQNWAHLGGKGYFDYVNQMLSLKPWESPKGFCKNYAFASISGFKEQVEGNVKACKRLIKQLNGEVVTEKFKEQLPGCYEKWQHNFVEHINAGMAKKLSHVYGVDGSEASFIVESNIKDCKKFHHSFLRILYKKYGNRAVRYYTRQHDHGRITFMRYVWMHDKYDEETLNKELFIQNQLSQWMNSQEFKDEFPNVRKFPEANALPKYNLAKLWSRIEKLLDPNNIMHPAEKGLQSRWRGPPTGE